MNEVLVDKDKCVLCCECINICSQDVLGIQKGKVAVINFDDCTFCEECVDICENDGIKVKYDITM